MAEVNRRPNPKVPALRGKTVCNVFFEDSTRTRLSFETAAKRLSADTMNFAVSSSSVNKGESLRDTIETIAAMGVDAFVIRHGSSGVPWQVEQWTTASVVNAGDGWHAHPTQALLDCYTIRTALHRRENFDGLKIAIVGDVKHSRVARSDISAFTLLGADVTLVAPRTLLPPAVDVPTTTDLDDVIDQLRSAANLDGKDHVDLEIVSPLQRDADDDVDDLLAGDFAGAFGGFLDRRLRQSDFALGWRSTTDWAPDVLRRHGLSDETVDAVEQALDEHRPDWMGEVDLEGDGVGQLGRRGRLRLALLAAQLGRLVWSSATPPLARFVPGKSS